MNVQGGLWLKEQLLPECNLTFREDPCGVFYSGQLQLSWQNLLSRDCWVMNIAWLWKAVTVLLNVSSIMLHKGLGEKWQILWTEMLQRSTKVTWALVEWLLTSVSLISLFKYHISTQMEIHLGRCYMEIIKFSQ